MPLYRRLPKRGFKNINKIKIQQISIKTLNQIITKYSLDVDLIQENDLFKRKIFKKSKGNLKLLNVGKTDKKINIEISYASKSAISSIEKAGGKVQLLKN